MDSKAIAVFNESCVLFGHRTTWKSNKVLGTAEAIWHGETDLMRGPESSLCSDDLDSNPVWFCKSKVIKTQACEIKINDGQKQQLN